MKTTNTTIYMYFHIGRGNLFNNPGTVTFRGECDFQDLIARRSDICTIINEDEDGDPLPDNEWQLIQDASGSTLIKGREAIEAKTGVLDFDGVYDTDYVITADQMGDKELEAAYNTYLNGGYMSDELKDKICTMKGEKRLQGISCFSTNMLVYTQSGLEHIDVDQQAGEFTREQWNDYLCERGFCPLSVEEILHMMEYFSTNETEFFKED